jgi:hypothetical protein
MQRENRRYLGAGPCDLTAAGRDALEDDRRLARDGEPGRLVRLNRLEHVANVVEESPWAERFDQHRTGELPVGPDP